MLLKFSVDNFRSIASRQEFSMMASNLKGQDDSIIDTFPAKFKVLPVAVIYGPNASGKSNFLKALQFFISEILNSQTRAEGAKIDRKSFCLYESNQIPNISRFECDFLIKDFKFGNSAQNESAKNIRFTYGFEVSDSRVEQEWLFAYPKGYKQVWLHRNASENEEFYFGKELKGENKAISKYTSENHLFLSFASKHPQLAEVVAYFKLWMIEFNSLHDSDKHPKIALKHDLLKSLILTFISEADLGICDMKLEDKTMPEERAIFLKKFQNLLKETFGDDVPETGNIQKVIRLGHKGQGNNILYFDREDESKGTLALMNLLSLTFAVILIGGILVIDELDSSLHPLFCRKIVELFNSKNINTKNAQLIFSTHDTTILSADLLRRDEVWFTEKDHDGATTLYSLADFDVRETDNFEKGYLQGKFGAIPYFGKFEF